MSELALKGKDLAAAAGVTPTAVSRYLSGRVPSSDELYRISRSLRVSMEWLLTGEDLRGESGGIDESLLKTARLAAERLAARLSEAELELGSIQRLLAQR